jgi:hypothetical protein
MLRYKDHTLSAGKSAAHLAVWPGKSDPSDADCATALRAAPSAATIPATAGERICVEFTGKPARYGFIQVARTDPTAMTGTATTWP